MKPVMNLDDVKFDDIEENGLYTSSRGQISDHIGAKNLGYNLTVLPPGKAQCPFHCHHDGLSERQDEDRAKEQQSGQDE